jgi:hypothetical protein
MFRITESHLQKALSFEDYHHLSERRYNEGASTSADAEHNTPEILGYVKLNLARMNRLSKTVNLRPDLSTALQSVKANWVWLVLSESWCGDAAQNVPVLEKMAAESNGKISLRILLRDENPDVMDDYLTNGSRSIPKLICLDAKTLQEVGVWGPRPAEAQQKMNEWKALPLSEKIEKVHAWYAANETAALQREFVSLIASWEKTIPTISDFGMPIAE